MKKSNLQEGAQSPDLKAAWSAEAAETTPSSPANFAAEPDNLARETYCILGLPIDAVDLPEVLDRIVSAVQRRASFFISTPNINFIVSSLTNGEFRETILASDLSPPDGMPLV